MTDPLKAAYTTVDQVTLVDETTDSEVTLENTTGFDENGKIVSYNSEVVDPEKESGGVDTIEEEQPVLSSSVEKASPTMEEALSDLGDSLTLEDEEEKPITSDDIKKSLETSMFNENNEFHLPDQDILVLLDIVEKVKKKENINIYSSLPQSVKDMINKYMLEQGVQGYSVQANSIRNMLAATLIDEFITNISVNKTIDSFNEEMENLFAKTGEEFSKMYKEYDTERTKYLEAALEKIPEGDPKRETVTKVLDAINDAYTLNRLKEAFGKLKIKNFDREKPERVFSDFEFKYKDKSYRIYPIMTVAATLHKHLIENIKTTLPEDMSDEDKLARADVIASIEALDFMLLFCKFCKNYKAEVPEEHAFMYYTLYNIMLLDVYKGEEYEDFAHGLINNIIEAYKPYYKKIMSEENFNKRFG